MKSILPIIFIILALTGAITYTLAKKVTPKKDVTTFGIPANELEDTLIPKFQVTNDVGGPFGLINATPTPTPSVTVTPSIAISETTEVPLTEETDSATTKGGEKVVAKKTVSSTKTTVCTPVYGSANTCTEHVVVDTGASDSIFFNLAGFAYIGGLVSFIKAKSLKR